MASRYQNITIDQGATFSWLTQVYSSKEDTSVLNTDNHWANGQIRKSYYHANAVATFDIINNHGIDTLIISMNSASTSTLSPGKYVYDIEITKDVSGVANTITRVLEGIATVTPEVTK
jgi:hypothetical protein